MSRSAILPLAICIAVGATAVAAHEGATGIVHERMEAMKSMATAMRALAEMFEDPESFDRDQALRASESVASHAETMPELFPEGSDHPPTKATQGVWSDREGFLARAVELHDAALAFEVDAEAGAGLAVLKPDFDTMAESCQACHEHFRQPGGDAAF